MHGLIYLHAHSQHYNDTTIITAVSSSGIASPPPIITSIASAHLDRCYCLLVRSSSRILRADKIIRLTSALLQLLHQRGAERASLLQSAGVCETRTRRGWEGSDMEDHSSSSSGWGSDCGESEGWWSLHFHTCAFASAVVPAALHACYRNASTQKLC